MVYCLRALISLVIFAVISAGAEIQESSLDGRYLRVSQDLFERIVISGLEFYYHRGALEKADSWGEGFPIRGKIEIEGETVTLVHPRLIDADQKFRVVDEGEHTYLVRVSELVGDAEINLEETGLRKFRERSMITSE